MEEAWPQESSNLHTHVKDVFRRGSDDLDHSISRLDISEKPPENVASAPTEELHTSINADKGEEVTAGLPPPTQREEAAIDFPNYDTDMDWTIQKDESLARDADIHDAPQPYPSTFETSDAGAHYSSPEVIHKTSETFDDMLRLQTSVKDHVHPPISVNEFEVSFADHTSIKHDEVAVKTWDNANENSIRPSLSMTEFEANFSGVTNTQHDEPELPLGTPDLADKDHIHPPISMTEFEANFSGVTDAQHDEPAVKTPHTTAGMGDTQWINGVQTIANTAPSSADLVQSTKPMDTDERAEGGAVDSWDGRFKTEGETDDAWSDAFKTTELQLDAAWGAAFEDIFQEDGFLEDELVQAQATPSTIDTARQNSANLQPARVAGPKASAQTYSAAHNIEPAQTRSPASNPGPMKFFEELPSAQNIRRRPKPQQVVSYSQPSPPNPTATSTFTARPMPPPRQSTVPLSQFRPPERLSPFPSQASAFQSSLSTSIPTKSYSSSPQPGPPAKSRYSPALPQAPGPSNLLQSIPPPNNFNRPPAISHTSDPFPPLVRPPPEQPFSSLPEDFSRPLPPPPVNRFAPRTSSPLAQTSYQQERPVQEKSLPADNSVARKASYVGTYQPHNGIISPEAPPPRARTASPEISRVGPTSAASGVARPPSDHMVKPPPALPPPQTRMVVSAPRQQLMEPINLMTPQDERASDPLQRWQGCPIFRWNAGGIISTGFPKRVPLYAGGQSMPVFKNIAGEVKLRKSVDMLPSDDLVVSFPGPLKSKNKKKDVLIWLSSRIVILEEELRHSRSDPSGTPLPLLRLEEKIILWQLMRLLIERDGVLIGNTPNNINFQQLLCLPEVSNGVDVTNQDIGLIDTTTYANTVAAGFGSAEEVKLLLLRGESETAVWRAVDNGLWADALIIASTLDGSIWKGVVQEFVRKEVRRRHPNSRSIAALYEILAGSWEESIDELVPSSARAGFQMVSTTEAPSQQKNTLDGLNKWRETVSLVLSNRSSGDENALLSLGKLLASYGRIEAAHVCFIFSRSTASFGGFDDPQSHFTLLGIDMFDAGTDRAYDIEAVLLSEVYEFALSVLASGSSYQAPHLQAYKLYHAHALADGGRSNDAMHYCEAIATTMNSKTRSSPYFHRTLLSHLDDFAKRLSQTPTDGNSSWMSKPSIGKVSGSVWAMLNNFVAGDDNDNSSRISGDRSDNETGPFARINGETPTISRTSSVVDLPRSASFSGSGNGYGPASFVPRSSQEHERTPIPLMSRPSYQPLDYTSMNSGGSAAGLQTYRPSAQLARYHSQGGDHNVVDSHRESPFGSYIPQMPTVQESISGYNTGAAQYPAMHQSLQLGPNGQHSSLENHTDGNASTYGSTLDSYTPLSSDNDPVNGGYQPAAGGYEPPSYQPYQPDPDSPQAERKKRPFMGDEDVDFTQQEKAPKDREVDDAVKKAAEADAARDAQEKSEKKGWFSGGWFGKKDPNAPTVHRAKLGEESSFVYDESTKKWINKKVGITPEVPQSSGPPPRGPPSRPVSRNVSAHPPPATSASTLPLKPAPAAPSPIGMATLGSVSRTGTPLPNGNVADPNAIAANLQLPESGPPSAPPSRPSTSFGLSAGDSIDDLMGGPQARKGGTIKKGKKGGNRYVDVMAK